MCHIMSYPPPMPGELRPIHYYWDKHGDLCIETWEQDPARIANFIRETAIKRGLCGEDGKLIAKGREVAE